MRPSSLQERLPPRPSGLVVASLLLVYAVLVMLRMPEIVLKGRFWAEEGVIFFPNALRLPPLDALFFSYGGYLNLVANGSAVLARYLVPLEAAPFVTTGVALLFQLVPPAIVLTAPDRWLRPLPVRLVAVAMLLLVPSSDEIWLQSLHCQFELALAGALLLALDAPRGWRAACTAPVFVLAPLCGPAAIALLAPLLLRTAIDRSAARLIQLLALLLGSALQLGLFFTFGAHRGLVLDPAVLLAVVSVKNLLVPLIGVSTAGGYAARIHRAVLAGHVPWAAVVAPVVAFGALAIAAWRTGNRAALWLLIAGAVTALVAYAGALDGTVALIDNRTGARYAFVPLSLVALSVLALAATPSRARRVAIGLSLWLLIVGLRAYLSPWIPVRDGPAWPAEIAHWRADPAYPIKLWPPPWTVSLPANTPGR